MSLGKPLLTAEHHYQDIFCTTGSEKKSPSLPQAYTHSIEAIRTLLQARQDYSMYDAYAKEKSNLLPTQPIWVQTVKYR